MKLKEKKIAFFTPVDIKEVTKHKGNVKLRYARKSSTGRGEAWCTCGRSVSNLILLDNDKVIGWCFVRCKCGNNLDWSDAKENI